jgi:hypothetical protein
MAQVADIISKVIPEVDVEIVKDQSDKRSYQVCFEKIKRRLGFSAEYKISDSVKDIITAYQNENLFRDYRNQKYHNVLSLKEC